jgi:endonuclease/exonuclease/phosphatase family metal-dependent hydrolase
MEHVKRTKSGETRSIRVATYNIHKCRGLDGRVRPERIVKVLREVNADIIALQEVVGAQGKGRRGDQVRYIAEELGFHFELGENRRHKGGAYGNLLLSRFPISAKFNYDISVRGYERRGCLRTDVMLDEARSLHVFNIHMGTSFFERRHQARRLVDAQVLNHEGLNGTRLVLGDFNEWTRGLASRLLSAHFRSADVRALLKRRRTYPGVLPLMHLDHIYFDPELELRSLTLHRSRTALLASDHLPLVAEFNLVAKKEAPDTRSVPYYPLSYPETRRMRRMLQKRNHGVVHRSAELSSQADTR